MVRDGTIQDRRRLAWLAAVPLVLFAVTAGLVIKPHTRAAGPVAPATPTAVCGQSILNSPYSYNGASGTFTTSGTPAGLPTFGTAGTDFPSATQVIVVPTGDNTTAAHNTGSYDQNNTIVYFEPGHHTLSDVMYAGNNSVYIGGYSPTAGKAVIDGVNGATPNGLGGSEFVTSTPVSAQIVNDTYEYLTIENFTSSNNGALMGGVNGGNYGWGQDGSTYKYNTIGPNEYGYAGDTVAPRTGESSGGGYAIYMGNNNDIEYNCINQNAQGAFAGTTSPGFSPLLNPIISHNEISANGLGEYPDNAGPGNSPFACGCSGGGKLFFSVNAVIDYNYIHDNYNAGIWLDWNNTGADMSYNYISSNWGPGIDDEAGYNANITYNTLVGNGWASNGAWPAGIGGQACYNGVSCAGGFGPITGAGGGNPYGAISIAGTSGNANLATINLPGGGTVTSNYSGHVNITGNVLTNNFGGVEVYTDTNRYPDNIFNDSACGTPLAPLNQQNSSLYYRQTKFLQTGADASVSGASVATASGTSTLCGNYDSGTQEASNVAVAVHAPAVGMGVYNENTGAFLGNVATVTSANAFTLDRSPGNTTGATLELSAYGGCGPADYYGAAHGQNSGQPAADYFDNCLMGSQNVTVSGNTFSIQADQITGCTTANLCGYNKDVAFNAGVPKLEEYFDTWSDLTGKAVGGLGNVYSNNTYVWSGGGPGAWQFQAGLQGNYVTQAAWQAAPYGQDAGSTFGTTLPSTTPTPVQSITPTPSATPSGKVGDLNNDNQVNIFDLSILLSAWGTANTTADINHDGTVNIFDLSILLSHWGT
jgi:hypothetical protein